MLPASGFDRVLLLAVAVRLVHHPALTTAGDGTRCDVTSTRTLAEALAEIIAMNAPLGERLAAYAEALRRSNPPSLKNMIASSNGFAAAWSVPTRPSLAT